MSDWLPVFSPLSDRLVENLHLRPLYCNLSTINSMYSIFFSNWSKKRWLDLCTLQHYFEGKCIQHTPCNRKKKFQKSINQSFTSLFLIVHDPVTVQASNYSCNEILLYSWNRFKLFVSSWLLLVIHRLYLSDSSASTQLQLVTLTASTAWHSCVTGIAHIPPGYLPQSSNYASNPLCNVSYVFAAAIKLKPFVTLIASQIMGWKKRKLNCLTIVFVDSDIFML